MSDKWWVVVGIDAHGYYAGIGVVCGDTKEEAIETAGYLRGQQTKDPKITAMAGPFPEKPEIHTALGE